MFVISIASIALAASPDRFICPTVSIPPEPSDVKKLHPGHVKYVMAMGDSITAAFAARSTLFEGRDISWSIGAGSAEQLTLPYLISQYSTSVSGQSVKAVLPKDITNLPDGDYHPDTDHLNVAESSGAVHRGSMVQQWGYLSKAVADESQYPKFNASWKVLTIWMMANDVCGAGSECDRVIGANDTFTKSFVDGYEQLLHNVSSTMQNVYVSLVTTLDLSHIHRLQQESGIFCKVEHRFILRECGCIDRGNATQLAHLDANVHVLNSALHGVAARWQAKLAAQGRRDMAVVVQPYQEGLGAQLNPSFLNHLDCFHPSASAHQYLATGLWNMMLCKSDRAGKCGHSLDPNNVTLTCPTAESTFYS